MRARNRKAMRFKKADALRTERLSEILSLAVTSGGLVASAQTSDDFVSTETIKNLFKKNPASGPTDMPSANEIKNLFLKPKKTVDPILNMQTAPVDTAVPISSTNPQAPSALPNLPKKETPPPTPATPLGPNEYMLPGLRFESASCSSCAQKALSESAKYWDNGNVREDDHYYPDGDTEGEQGKVEDTIMKYWRYTSENNSREQNIDRWGFDGTRQFGPRAGEHQMNPVKERDQNGVAKKWWAWSAVYTSYIMGLHDGEGAKWYVSESHSVYEDAYKRKRKEIEKDPSKHIGETYYLWFSTAEKDRYNIKVEPGDLVGHAPHYDIYVGQGQMLGGNTCAKNEFTSNRRTNCAATSGAQPLRFRPDGGIIKRVKITGPTEVSDILS